MLLTGEAVLVWDRGVQGNSVLSTQFCCEPKAALKNKVYLKQQKKVYLTR